MVSNVHTLAFKGTYGLPIGTTKDRGSGSFVNLFKDSFRVHPGNIRNVKMGVVLHHRFLQFEHIRVSGDTTTNKRKHNGRHHGSGE